MKWDNVTTLQGSTRKLEQISDLRTINSTLPVVLFCVASLMVYCLFYVTNKRILYRRFKIKRNEMELSPLGRQI